jgi:xyloglucan-specific exo-beta-1,4-glucanase
MRQAGGDDHAKSVVWCGSVGHLGARDGSRRRRRDRIVGRWHEHGLESSGRPITYSLDNAQTWVACTGVPVGSYVGSDRAVAGRFYAYSNGVFYVSADRGATFTPTGAAGLPVGGARFKAVAGHPGEIWLSAGTAGLWHSIDGGVTFSRLPSVQQADTIGFGMPKRKDGYPAMYTSAQIAGTTGLFRSDDAGQHWIRINDDQHQYAVTNTAITGDSRVYGRVYVGTNGRGVIYGEPDDTQRHN